MEIFSVVRQIEFGCLRITAVRFNRGDGGSS